MKKTTLCSIINLSLVAFIWIGLVLVFCRFAGLVEIWMLVLVGVCSLPVAGYLVQYFLSPIVNRVIVGKVVG